MSAYIDDYKGYGYDTVLDRSSYGQTPAYQRERMSDANIAASRRKSRNARKVTGFAVLPIVEEKKDNIRKTNPTSESTTRRSQTRKVSMSLKSYQRRLAAAAVLSTTIALGGFGLGKKAVEYYKEASVINTYNRAFDKEVIRPERHATLDHMNYYYDYSDIAQKVMDYDNIDEAVFLLVFNIGDYQADRVLGCTPYHSLESFLELRGYKDTSDLRKKGRELILLDDEVKKKQKKLNDMKSEHADYIFEPSQEMDTMFSEPALVFDTDDVHTYSGGVK